MAVRIITLTLLVSFALAPAALGDPAFQPLQKEYLERIGDEGRIEERVALVDRVAAFGNREAAQLLIDSIEILSGSMDRLLRNLDELEAAHEELNTNQDVARDDFKTRTELRKKIMAEDVKIAAHRRVLERIRKTAIEFKAIEAQAYVTTMAQRGSVWRLRGIAAHASALYPTEEGRKAAVKALRDKEPRVVIQALIGLKARKDPETIEPIVKCLTDDVWVVQSFAAEALAEIGSKLAVRPLIDALAKTEGRVRDDINEALRTLTGQSFDADHESWMNWYEEHKAEFEGGDAKPLARGRRGKNDDEDSTYYGIPTPSKRIVYVIDISGSMTLEIGGAGTSTPAPGEEEKFSGPKIEIAKKELIRAIRKLPEDAHFNIITFNHLVKTWDEKMVEATQANKNKAYVFIRELRAKGSTFTYGALKEVFKLAGMGALDPEYESGVNTVFLLSDGAPTDQSYPTAKLMDPEKILTAVRDWNSLSKVVIHAIAIDPKTQGSTFIKFMKQLADQNGGKYLERG